MGGNIAGTLSALYPEMVDAVVLLDSYGFLPTDLKEIPNVVRQGIEEMLQYEKKEKKERVYTYKTALERLLVANPALSEQSAHNLLERGLVQVDGGVRFSRDFRINLKGIVRSSLELLLELQSRIQAHILVVLAEDGFVKRFMEPDQQKFVSTILQGYRDLNALVAQVEGDHHVHLNHPEAVAPLICDFLREKVSLRLPDSAESTETSKL